MTKKKAKSGSTQPDAAGDEQSQGLRGKPLPIRSVVPSSDSSICMAVLLPCPSGTSKRISISLACRLALAFRTMAFPFAILSDVMLAGE